MPSKRAELWKKTASVTLETAKSLRDSADFRSCISRTYYAAYQAAASACIAHGDAPRFPVGWNNPSHEQLPDLVQNNGDLDLSARRTAARILRLLRNFREDADYRPGRTVDSVTVRTALLAVVTLFEVLEIADER
jgi:uncharacterized protein (UPF0332 family)